MALAIELNAEGFRVFPVEFVTNSDGSMRKKPVIRSYHGDRPFTARQIRSWPWERADALGWAIPTGFVLLDVDIKHGKTGDQHLAQLQTLHGPLPATAQQATQSGGLHLVCRLPCVVEAFHNKVPLNLDDGVFAAIDICHPKLRYMRIYDFTIFDQAVATLPMAWVELITKPTKPTKPRSSAKASTAGQIAVSASEGHWAQLGQAIEGDRNDQLNKAVFVMASAGLWNDDHDTRASEVARDIGLDDEQIVSTIASAVAAGRRQRAKPENWYEELQHDPRLHVRRNRLALLQTGAELRELAVGRDMTVGLAVRDLALRLGVSHQTAARYLGVLRRLGYLRRVSLLSKTEATRFKLTTPPGCSRSDSQPVGFAGSSSSKQQTGGLSPLGTASTAWLYRHDAFIRMAGTVHLPKSCAPVLEALAVSASTVTNLAAATGQPRSTVHRAVVILQSAGLVSYDSQGTRIVEPCDRDLHKALDAWAAFSHAKGNHERLETRFALHRVLRDQPREDSKARGVPWSARKGALG